MQSSCCWLQLHSIASSPRIGKSSGNNKSHCSSLSTGYNRSRRAMFEPVRFHNGLTNNSLTLLRCYCDRNIVNSKIKSILILTKLDYCFPMHLRTMWRSGAAANGSKCICLEHPPSMFAIFRAKNSHRGLGPPPLSKRKSCRAKPPPHRMVCW